MLGKTGGPLNRENLETLTKLTRRMFTASTVIAEFVDEVEGIGLQWYGACDADGVSIRIFWDDAPAAPDPVDVAFGRRVVAAEEAKAAKPDDAPPPPVTSSGTAWIDDEEALAVKMLRGGSTAADVAVSLGRSERSTMQKCTKLRRQHRIPELKRSGRPKGMDWTPEIVSELLDFKRHGYCLGDIATKMGISQSRIAGKLRRIKAEADREEAPAQPEPVEEPAPADPEPAAPGEPEEAPPPTPGLVDIPAPDLPEGVRSDEVRAVTPKPDAPVAAEDLVEVEEQVDFEEPTPDLLEKVEPVRVGTDYRPGERIRIAPTRIEAYTPEARAAFGVGAPPAPVEIPRPAPYQVTKPVPPAPTLPPTPAPVIDDEDTGPVLPPPDRREPANPGRRVAVGKFLRDAAERMASRVANSRGEGFPLTTDLKIVQGLTAGRKAAAVADDLGLDKESVVARLRRLLPTPTYELQLALIAALEAEIAAAIDARANG